MNIIYKLLMANALLPTALLFSLQPAPAAAPDGAVRFILNMANDYQLPRNFRTANGPFVEERSDGLPLPSRQGLDGLRISGSAQFSADALQAIVATLPTDKLVLVDLRQESHGFVNDHAVSWYGPLDWANLGKSPLEIEKDQALRLHGLLAQSDVMLFPDKASHEPIYLDVGSVCSERRLARQQRVAYRRFYVTDHVRPTDQQVDEFLAFYRSLPSDSWLHFHCAGGRGRTTTFMAMVDILHNARQVSCRDIIDRQWLIGGLQLDSLSEELWKRPYAQQRYHFLTVFYDYARSGTTLSWSQWLQESGALPPFTKVPLPEEIEQRQ